MIFRKVNPKPYLKQRCIATLIDYGIFLTLCYIYIITFGTETEQGIIQVTGLLTLPIPICWFIYFVMTEAINQSTPGHDICKLKVYKSDASRIGLYDALKRRICDPVDLFIYGIPALITISKSPKHQRLGDMLADTVVCKPSDIEINEVVF